MHTEHLKISNEISIPVSDIELAAIRAQGAGGQNVNKVSSAVHLRFDIRNCAALPDDLKQRLLKLNDKRINADGVIVIKAQVFRTREKNVNDGLRRLTTLLQSALKAPKPRKKTKISRSTKQKRLDNKRQRSKLKQDRRRIDSD